MMIEDQIFEARDLGDPNSIPKCGSFYKIGTFLFLPQPEVMGLVPHTQSIHPQKHIDPLSIYYSIPFQAFLPRTTVCPP